jgi:hypothetical protein
MKKTSCLISLFLLSAVAVAQAQSPVPLAECAASPPCKLLFDRAQQQSAAGQLVDALRSYKLAYAVTPDPRLLYSIARVLHKQGQPTEAIPYYRQFLVTPFTRPADEAQKTPAQEFLTQCEAVQKQKIDITKPPSTTTPDTPPVPVEAKRPPVYKRWWFWTIVGGAAAGIAAGVAIGVTRSQSPPNFRPFDSQ